MTFLSLVISSVRTASAARIDRFAWLVRTIIDADESRLYPARYENVFMFSFWGRGGARLRRSRRIDSFISCLRIAYIPRAPRKNGCFESALWRSHGRDFQATQHEECWLLGAGRCACIAESVYLHSRASQPARGREELGSVSSRSGMEKGEGRVRGARPIG